MAMKNRRLGGKYTRKHSAVSPTAATLTDFASEQQEVSRIRLGFIKAGARPVNGERRVKFTDEEGALLLSVRDNTAFQEVRIYTSNMNETRTKLARQARNLGMDISFTKKR